MKLWIDDIRNAPDETWHVCRTVQSAIKAIHQFGADITCVSLDHDISHQVGIGVGVPRPMPCSETFQSVAHYLGLLVIYQNAPLVKKDAPFPLWNPIVSIHSANPVGAREIYNILIEYDLAPVIDPLPQANRLEMTL